MIYVKVCDGKAVARQGKKTLWRLAKMSNGTQNPSPSPEWIRKAQSGNREAMDQLLRQYAPLLAAMAERFAPESATPEDVEDLYQEASILFCQAVMSFDVRQEDVELGLYARICIKNGLVSLLRKQSRRAPTVPLEESDIAPSDSAEEDPVRALIDRESSFALCRTIENALSPYENRIWWLYLSGRTAKEIGLLVGREERSVQNAIYRIRKKLRLIVAHP